MRLVMVSMHRRQDRSRPRSCRATGCMPEVERELQQKTERERLGVSVAAMKAAIKEALEAEAEAAARQAECDAASRSDRQRMIPTSPRQTSRMTR